MNASDGAPPWAEKLLRLVAPADDRDDLLDELYDEFARERSRRGERAARAWFAREVFRSLVPILSRRVLVAIHRPHSGGPVRHRIEAVLSDLAYAMWRLRREPGFTITVLLTFALGIGANATMFGIVDDLLLRPPPHVRAPRQIVTLAAGTAEDGFEQRHLNYPVFAAIRDHSASFSQVAAVASVTVPFGRGGQAADLDGLLVSASYFPLLGVALAEGRFFRDEEDVAPIGAPVVVISDAFWQRHFSGSRDALGATLHLGDRQFTVIGIAPPDFTGLGYVAPDVWLPISSGGAMNFLGTRWATQSIVTWLRIYGRVRPGVPTAAAATDAMRVAREAAPEAFFTQTGWDFQARPLMAARSEEQGASATVAALLGTMALSVLLIACANVANLLLARGVRRRRDMALRLALGGTRTRLVQQVVSESVVLAALGGVAALVLAAWGGALARRLLLGHLGLEDRVLDPRVLAFTAAVALLVGVVTGLVPALQASRAPLVSTITAIGDRGGVRRSPAQNALLAVQAALSLVLLVGAGLFGRSLFTIHQLRMGVDIDRVLVGSMNLRSIGRPTSEADAVFTQALERVARAHGVAAAAISATVPFGPSFGTLVGVMGPDSIRHYTTTYNLVTPHYFETLGAALFRGRDFTDGDHEGAPRVVIINEIFGTRAWGHEDPVGRCVHIDADSLPCATVIGVVENVRRQSMFEDSTNFVYFPLAQARARLHTRLLVARAAGDPATVAATVRRAMQTAAPELPFADVRLVKDEPVVRHETLPFRLGTAMLGVFGGLALVLAAVGVYGVVSYDVGQRTREIGVRMALGACATDVSSLVMRDGLRMVVIGGIIGTGIVLAASRLVRPLLYATSPRDPVVVGGVALVLLAVATLACLLPARRAMRIDINSAIREE